MGCPLFLEERMAIIVNSVKTSLSEESFAAIEKAVRQAGLTMGQVTDSCIVKTSLDARKRTDIHFVHSVALMVAGEEEAVVRAAKDKNVVVRREEPLRVTPGSRPLEKRPVIVGFGPGGMFAGLLLARYGYRPIILERGGEVEERIQAVQRFWDTGRLDETTNVQFGEGGAGTFSDGKLTTRIGDPKCSWVLRELVNFGAPKEILQKAKPHIGTDKLRGIVKKIRQEIIRLGGEVFFHTPLMDISVHHGKIDSLLTPMGNLPAQVVILATGHSARDTFGMFHTRGLEMQAKPFSVGVRIEHLQKDIDRGLYGEFAGHKALPVGEYQLSHRINDRGVYTFCMCPGGVVVPAASQTGMTVTNGMSYFSREGENANSALVVGVTPEDFGTDPLDGIRFQQDLERAAFQAGGTGYQAPAQDAGSFLRGKGGFSLGTVKPTYALGVQGCDFTEIFPDYVTEMLKIGLTVFERKLPGFAAADAVLTGVETRTSSPVRIVRGENFQSSAVQGIYPCAEGAGYAGGIMSAAVDGLRVALSIIEEYGPME